MCGAGPGPPAQLAGKKNRLIKGGFLLQVRLVAGLRTHREHSREVDVIHICILMEYRMPLKMPIFDI